jgi:hypothetical protein
VGERWTTWWESDVLLGRSEIDDGWPAGWERASLLCERERESKTAGWEKGGRLGVRGLFGRREIGNGITVGWKRTGLLGGSE